MIIVLYVYYNHHYQKRLYNKIYVKFKRNYNNNGNKKYV